MRDVKKEKTVIIELTTQKLILVVGSNWQFFGRKLSDFLVIFVRFTFQETL